LGATTFFAVLGAQVGVPFRAIAAHGLSFHVHALAVFAAAAVVFLTRIGGRLCCFLPARGSNQFLRQHKDVDVAPRTSASERVGSVRPDRKGVRALAKCAGVVQLHVLPSLVVGVSQRRVQRMLALVFEVSVGTPAEGANDVAGYFDNGRLVDFNRLKNEIAIRRSLRRASTFPVGFIVRCHALKPRHNDEVQVAPASTASKPAVLISLKRECVSAFLERRRMVHS